MSAPSSRIDKEGKEINNWFVRGSGPGRQAPRSGYVQASWLVPADESSLASLL
jgi:hypothetical protein